MDKSVILCYYSFRRKERFMKLYYGTSTKNTDCTYDGYLKINNCGCFEDICSNYVVREHGRLDYQLIYIQSGEMTVWKNGKQIVFKAGEVYLFRPYEPQRYSVQETPTTYYWIHFTGKAVEEILSFWSESHFYIGAFPEIEGFCRSFYRDYKIPGAFQSLYYEGRLISLLGSIAKKQEAKINKKRYERVSAVLDYFEKVFPRKPSNEELAAVCYMNKYHFIKVFKETVGEAPQSYLNRMIVEKAKTLLESTTFPIGEIASRLGFSDPLYFSRLFKKHCGISPKDYREK